MQSGDDYVIDVLRSYTNNFSRWNPADRTVECINLVLGDGFFKYLSARGLGTSLITFVKSFSNGTIAEAMDYLSTSIFVNVKNVVVHFGLNDLNSYTPKQVFFWMKALLVLIKMRMKDAKIHISLPIPWSSAEGIRRDVAELMDLYVSYHMPTVNIFVISNLDFLEEVATSRTEMSTRRGSRMITENLRRLLEIEDDE